MRNQENLSKSHKFYTRRILLYSIKNAKMAARKQTSAYLILPSVIAHGIMLQDKGIKLNSILSLSTKLVRD